MSEPDYKATQPELRAAMGTGRVIPYPECYECGKSDAVRESPSFPASEWYCLRCEHGWMQPW